MKQFKIVVEKYPDTYVAYPLGMKGVVVGQGDSYETALEDVKSAIKFHIETFGPDEINTDPSICDAKRKSRWHPNTSYDTQSYSYKKIDFKNDTYTVKNFKR